MIGDIFASAALVSVAFGTLEPMGRVVLAGEWTHLLTIDSRSRGVLRLPFLKLILLVTLLAFDNIESFSIEGFFHFLQFFCLNELLDLKLGHLCSTGRTLDIPLFPDKGLTDVLPGTIQTDSVQTVIQVCEFIHFLHLHCSLALRIHTLNCTRLLRLLFKTIELYGALNLRCKFRLDMLLFLPVIVNAGVIVEWRW